MNIVDPLTYNVKITNPDGTPTPEFLRYLLQRSNLVQNTVPDTRKITPIAPLTGGGDLSQDRVIGLADSPVGPGTYGDATNVAQITVDEFGRVTAALDVPITGGGGGGGDFSQISRFDVSVAASTFTFTAIPGTFDDLQLVIQGEVAGSTGVTLNFNGDVGSNYDWRVENRLGTGTGSGDTKASVGDITPTSVTSYPSSFKTDIYGYANATFFRGFFTKSVSSVLGGGGNNLLSQEGMGVWKNNSTAITSILVTTASALQPGSSLVLYGRGT